MPRKIRQLRSDVKRRGFHIKSTNGSHQKWAHILLPGFVLILAGNDNKDAKRYQEDDIAEALELLDQAERQLP